MLDLRQIDLNLLVSLDALLEECNVTRASRRLNLSQSSLSAQLARLRDIFQDPLLIPAASGRGMTPTARALSLALPLRAALKDVEAVIIARPSFDPLRDERSFQIAASDSAVIDIGLKLIEQFNLHAGPGIRVGFRSPDASKVGEQLEQGAIDLLIAPDQLLPASMRRRSLMVERFVVAQRKGHPRGGRAPDLAEYCSLPHMLVSPSGGSFQGFIDDRLQRLGRSRRVVLSVQHFTLALAVLHATDYVATLPSRLVGRYAQGLDSFPLPFDVGQFDMSVAWHPRNHNDPALIWLRGLVLAAAQG